MIEPQSTKAQTTASVAIASIATIVSSLGVDFPPEFRDLGQCRRLGRQSVSPDNATTLSPSAAAASAPTGPRGPVVHADPSQFANELDPSFDPFCASVASVALCGGAIVQARWPWAFSHFLVARRPRHRGIIPIVRDARAAGARFMAESLYLFVVLARRQQCAATWTSAPRRLGAGAFDAAVRQEIRPRRRRLGRGLQSHRLQGDCRQGRSNENIDVAQHRNEQTQQRATAAMMK